MLTRVDSSQTRMIRVRLVLIRVDLCWFVLTRVHPCWYSCIGIDLIDNNSNNDIKYSNHFINKRTSSSIFTRSFRKFTNSCPERIQHKGQDAMMGCLCIRNQNHLQIFFFFSSSFEIAQLSGNFLAIKVFVIWKDLQTELVLLGWANWINVTDRSEWSS